MNESFTVLEVPADTLTETDSLYSLKLDAGRKILDEEGWMDGETDTESRTCSLPACYLPRMRTHDINFSPLYPHNTLRNQTLEVKASHLHTSLTLPLPQNTNICASSQPEIRAFPRVPAMARSCRCARKLVLGAWADAGLSNLSKLTWSKSWREKGRGDYRNLLLQTEELVGQG